MFGEDPVFPINFVPGHAEPHPDPHRNVSLYTKTFLHTDPLHTDVLTQKHFDIQTLLGTAAFTHIRFYTQTLSHTHT